MEPSSSQVLAQHLSTALKQVLPIHVRGAQPTASHHSFADTSQYQADHQPYRSSSIAGAIKAAVQAPAFQAALQDALQPLVAQAEQKFAEEALACHSDLRDILADLSSLQTQLANPTQSSDATPSSAMPMSGSNAGALGTPRTPAVPAKPGANRNSQRPLATSQGHKPSETSALNSGGLPATQAVLPGAESGSASRRVSLEKALMPASQQSSKSATEPAPESVSKTARAGAGPIPASSRLQPGASQSSPAAKPPATEKAARAGSPALQVEVPAATTHTSSAELQPAKRHCLRKPPKPAPVLPPEHLASPAPASPVEASVNMKRVNSVVPASGHDALRSSSGPLPAQFAGPPQLPAKPTSALQPRPPAPAAQKQGKCSAAQPELYDGSAEEGEIVDTGAYIGSGPIICTDPSQLAQLSKKARRRLRREAKQQAAELALLQPAPKHHYGTRSKGGTSTMTQGKAAKRKAQEPPPRLHQPPQPLPQPALQPPQHPVLPGWMWQGPGGVPLQLSLAPHMLGGLHDIHSLPLADPLQDFAPQPPLPPPGAWKVPSHYMLPASMGGAPAQLKKQRKKAHAQHLAEIAKANKRARQAQHGDTQRAAAAKPAKQQGAPAKPARQRQQGLTSQAPLGPDNVGSRLLAGMGWTQGTGLGASRQGITEPIQAAVGQRRQGLGS